MGTTIFLTTHYMDEADSLSDRILVLDQGEIVAEGTPSELKQKVSGDTVTLTLRSHEDAIEAAGVVGLMADADEPVTEGHVVRFHVPNGGVALPMILSECNKADITAMGVEVNRPSLEDVFLTLTGRSLRD
ncbi:DUF4162 domain-containing protein [Devosia algicola]|uniref:DUF4162 domain-containing protein n=1 Tax=Devosia algicola TaxID=3026418 RepID=A0ABY7YN86_9HYPH|nr:DUF4162 domain-containing protein [Devosia algicola]WDR02499.1 DUF4162 domain-containing protein [Devosia algicola]